MDTICNPLSYICSLRESPVCTSFYLLMVLILIIIFGLFLSVQTNAGWFFYFMCIANTKLRSIIALNKRRCDHLNKGTALITCIVHLLVSKDKPQLQAQHTINILQDFLFLSFCLFITTIVIIEWLCASTMLQGNRMRGSPSVGDRICINSLTHWWLQSIFVLFCFSQLYRFQRLGNTAV